MKYSKRIQEERDFQVCVTSLSTKEDLYKLNLSCVLILIILFFFQSLLILLQNLPTGNWGYKDVELLVAEAFKLKCFFAEAPKHLQSK